jgi:hypothetical protein
MLTALAFTASACRDGARSEQKISGPSGDLVSLLQNDNGDGAPAGFRLTGGGRVDKQNHEPGKSPPGSHDFATFGFQARPTGPGTTDGSGNITWVEHNPNASPLGAFTFHGQVDHFSKPTDNDTKDDSDCGRFRGRGTVRPRLGLPVDTTFTVRHACDKGEPGRADHIRIKIDIPGNPGFQSDDGSGSYERHGLLTGGNIQKHGL